MSDNQTPETAAAAREPVAAPNTTTAGMTAGPGPLDTPLQQSNQPANTMPTSTTPVDPLKPDAAPTTGMDGKGNAVAEPKQDGMEPTEPGTAQPVPQRPSSQPVTKSVKDIPKVLVTSKTKPLGDDTDLNRHRS